MDPTLIAVAVILVVTAAVVLWAYITLKLWLRGLRLALKVLSVLGLLVGMAMLAASIAWAVTVFS